MEYKTDEEIKAEVEELYKDLPNGIYQIGDPSDGRFCAWTGRQGYIEFEIALRISARDELFNISTEQVKQTKTKLNSEEYSELTSDILDEFIKDLQENSLRKRKK